MPTRPNVLFVPVDDLRPQLGCYGCDETLSPHIDGLADEGNLFEQAYCQVPVCGASRASLLTGLRPARDRFVDFATLSDDDTPGARTLPQHFRENGYVSISNGKVFHHAHDAADRSWSRAPWHPATKHGWRNYLLEESLAKEVDNSRRGPPTECADVDDSAYADGQIADQTIKDLHELKEKKEPFLLAMGLKKPHLPFNAPKRYWNMYDREKIDLAGNPFRPEGAPDQAMHNFGELRNYFNVPREGPLSDDLARELIHGYYAATSYIDAQLGRVLKTLDDLSLRDNTIVVLWGDHGWQLGEHGLWCKHCNFDTSLNAPLIISAPDFRGGARTRSVVEFVDIYPTLCELAGLPLPEHLEGDSLSPQLHTPGGPGKDAAFSRYHAADSIRTGDYLYTEWTDSEGNRLARMLYDHASDPDENANIAERPEKAALVDDLSRRLRAGPGNERMM